MANDYGYENVYSKLIDGVGKAGDIFDGISTSENPTTISKAFTNTNEKNANSCPYRYNWLRYHRNIGLYIKTPSTNTPRIQKAQITVGHIICEIIEPFYPHRYKL